jgi:hypothetical protein
MDPFLEHPHFFPGLHSRFITRIGDSLTERLPEPYYADITDRVWVEASRRYIEPDVNVLRENGAEQEESAGGVAIGSRLGTRFVTVHVPHDERRETLVEIYSKQEGELLVTTIELLSLANKTEGEHGRELYLRKQREVLDSKVNLVEIDLLRGGLHTTAVPLQEARARAGTFDYHVCIHCADDLEDFFVCPIQLQERLPEIKIPLLPADDPVPLDLQAIFEECYDRGPYRRRVRYSTGEIIPPLQGDQAEWARQVLRDKGLGTAS